jgi:hypothetical protein
VFNLLQQLEALGLSVPGVLQQLGVSAAAPATVPDAVVPVVEVSGRPASKAAS